MALILASALALAILPPKHAYSFDAAFVEGCSCKDVCVTEITGRDAGCHGLGAMAFRSGTYGGKSLAGTSVAFAWDSGKWVRIYVDGPNPARRAVAADFMKAQLADWGKLVDVQNAKIVVTVSSKSASATIDDGSIGAIQIKGVIGGDGKHVVEHTNLASPLHSTLMQGETTSAALKGADAFELKATNGFFYPSCQMRGQI